MLMAHHSFSTTRLYFVPSTYIVDVVMFFSFAERSNILCIQIIPQQKHGVCSKTRNFVTQENESGCLPLPVKAKLYVPYTARISRVDIYSNKADSMAHPPDWETDQISKC